MDVREFDFDLPSELIAQEPAADRAGARLLCLDRRSGAITHSGVAALPNLLSTGDLVVVNNTQVFSARLIGRRVPSGGAVQVMLLQLLADENGAGPWGPREARPVGRAPGGEQYWEALVHPGQKLKPGAE